MRTWGSTSLKASIVRRLLRCCERLKHTASVSFIAVCQRFEKVFGIKPVLERTGEEVSFL